MARFVPNSTMIPNAFLDDVMCDLSDKALRSYLIIVRKTTGWNKEWDSISVSQFKQFTGIRDDRTVRRGLNELVEAGLIRSESVDGRPTKYSLVFDEPPAPDVPPSFDAPPTRDVGTPPTRDVGTPLARDVSHKRNYTKETNKRKESRKKTSLVIPDFVNRDSWFEFEQHRKDIRKPLTDLARQKAFNQLQILTKSEQREVIDYSIAGRYTGLFTDRFAGKQGAENGHSGIRQYGANETNSQRNARISEETSRQFQEVLAAEVANGTV